MFDPLAVVVVGAGDDAFDPVPVLDGYRIEEAEPFGSQVDRLCSSGPPYVTRCECLRGRPTQPWYQVEQGEGDHAEHDQHQHGP